MNAAASKGAILGILALVGALAPLGDRSWAQTAEDLRHMSIDQLAELDVSSVTKTSEALSDAPAAIFVITHEDIARSGATSIPEILRLAPNLQVAQTGASKYTITARGFSGATAAQNFPNKLLVLIDGRSVYTPLYSGVYWDMQDVLPQDIARIEVISGPGATLWGANAVNGVINIITRTSGETQGGLAVVSGGNYQGGVSLRYGGRIAENLTYRVYAKAAGYRDTLTLAGTRAHDNWTKPQGGFRVDWTPTPADTLTLQGDAYKGADAQAGAPDESIEGRNVLARWTHAGANGSALQVQAYYDRTARETEQGGGRFWLDTYDLDLQHHFTLGPRNELVWGGGVRFSRYMIAGPPSLRFAPPGRTLKLANIFVQDSISVTPTVKAVVGLKLEDDPYSGATLLPSVRLSWKPSDGAMLWAAASRAIRSPTPFDRDVVETLGTTVFLTGGANFAPEKLTAYEAGLRVQPSPRASFSLSAFYNVYDGLRTIEPTPVTFLPLQWGNKMKGYTFGVEAWGSYQVAPWWKLSAGFNFLSEHLKFSPGASGILGVAQAGSDPKHQASLRSSMNLGHDFTLDGYLRYVGARPDPLVPHYVELNGRLGWNITERVQLSLSVFNLLHDHHQEFTAPDSNAVPRSFLADLQWRF
ncbi:MAG: TonB-dependent receptor [Caulobacteraceae bacterium]